MYKKYADSVQFANINHIKVTANHPDLHLIATGRSAAVFRILSTNKAIKVFSPSFSYIAKIENDSYKKLIDIPHFPSIYESGVNYIVMDYIEGHTLFQCLEKGLQILPNHVKTIDSVLQEVKNRGLNPADIHLRNIIITNDNLIKIIDVARFKQENPCNQWAHLKDGYERFYNKKFFPKKIPAFILNFVAALYKNNKLPLYKHPGNQ